MALIILPPYVSAPAPIVCVRTQTQKIPGFVANDLFGAGVSISGDGLTIAIGATQHDSLASNAGAVYVYVLTLGVWTFQQKLTPGDSAPIADAVGIQVSLSYDGNTLLIGADRDDIASFTSTNVGAAYVYTRTAGVWSLQQKLQASDGVQGDRFGNAASLSSDGNTAVIGASGADPLGNASGAAYLFTRSAGVWTQAQKITAPGGAAGEQFGAGMVGISSDGSVVVLGAYAWPNNTTYQGRSYVFRKSGLVWAHEQTLSPSDPTDFDQFGIISTISSDGSTVVIGCLNNNTITGKVYVFRQVLGSWTELQKLTSPVTIHDLFGYSISCTSDGNILSLGSPTENFAGVDSGALYVYKHNGATWAFDQKLTAGDANESDGFGARNRISANGNTIVIGVPNADPTFTGAAYVFSC